MVRDYQFPDGKCISLQLCEPPLSKARTEPTHFGWEWLVWKCMECVWRQGLERGKGRGGGRNEEKEKLRAWTQTKTISGSPLEEAEVQSNLGRVSFPLFYSTRSLSATCFLPQVHPMIIFPFFVFEHFIFTFP